jgi:hypothetical protein
VVMPVRLNIISSQMVACAITHKHTTSKTNGTRNSVQDDGSDLLSNAHCAHQLRIIEVVHR